MFGQLTQESSAQLTVGRVLSPQRRAVGRWAVHYPRVESLVRTAFVLDEAVAVSIKGTGDLHDGAAHGPHTP